MLRDHWYIACASLRLLSQPLAVQVLDVPLAVFRDSGGSPHAVLDRCCHRGAPLSLGHVAGDTLACAYHGWRFDSSGACVHVPSLATGQRMPRGCAVQAWPCVERDGHVWVWMGVQPPVGEPGIPGFAAHGWLQGSCERACSSLLSLENTLDWCHPAFVHAGNHPQSDRVQQHGFADGAYEMRLHDNGVVLFAPATSAEAQPIPDDLDVLVGFDLPDRATVLRPGRGLHLVMHFVPTSPHSCRMEWLLHHAGVEHSGVRWSDDEGAIFSQDRLILEAVQRRLDSLGAAITPPVERSVEADAGPLMLRRIVELAAAGRWPAMRTQLRRRRIVRMRA